MRGAISADAVVLLPVPVVPKKFPVDPVVYTGVPQGAFGGVT